MTEENWEGADLVMEVVSSGNEDRRRALKTKREEYALAGIPASTGSSTRNSVTSLY